METEGIKSLLHYYGNSARRAFDVDLYHVGHHGSRNATTTELLDTMTPEVAVVSVGNWEFGKEPVTTFSTFSYGHPNRGIVSLLSTQISAEFNRATPAVVMLGNSAKSFTTYKVVRRIYATDWDGDITVRASLRKIEQVRGRQW
jgi:beta-lactamase superfamily II metal-dependent hydrolase